MKRASPASARVTDGAAADPLSSIQDFATRYVQAWNDHELEAILSMHTPDSEFWLHGADGLQKWTGLAGCREAFDFLLRALPDQHIEPYSVVVREDFLVAHSRVTGTLALPWPMAGRVYQPTGKPMQFEIVDIWHFRGDRLRIKEGWVDGLALHHALAGRAG
jgi:ketosteroid isomerase-like protein